ncbi:MAG: type II toxin-antitoxin system HipA family toxin [Rhodothermales bacterium]|nr:type II toxin-antitoxin system HipA family toxin [Rhodothermales bacterium]
MTVAEVRLWGRTIGAVYVEEDDDVASFEYDPDFAKSDIQISPIKMPLSRRLYRFPELSRTSFAGLPGLLADSIPDKFGNAVIDAWLASQGRSPESFDIVERLCYIGRRGMGALEFEPSSGPDPGDSRKVQVALLVDLASKILRDRQQFSTTLDQDDRPDGMAAILRVGTSAGGARAKAVVAWNPETNEVRSGQVDSDEGFEQWLLKFDGVTGNKDKELEDPQGYGVIEYAYYLMAREAGLVMSRCTLLEEGGRKHFMTRRFDRLRNGQKLHMQSLAAIAHFDFNEAGAYSYEQALLIMRQLELSTVEVEQQFRRMVFNVVARNQDDHVKNIAFLMDKRGVWSLSPAFDVTYSYNPSGAWTGQHQMTINGKRNGFVMDDFKACGEVALLKRGRFETIVDEVTEVVSNWRTYADKAAVPEETAVRIAAAHRLDIL